MAFVLFLDICVYICTVLRLPKAFIYLQHYSKSCFHLISRVPDMAAEPAMEKLLHAHRTAWPFYDFIALFCSAEA